MADDDEAFWRFLFKRDPSSALELDPPNKKSELSPFAGFDEDSEAEGLSVFPPRGKAAAGIDISLRYGDSDA